jgi:serine-type D-Ala-D-Ala carboxypeptidase (penicillin-binding protein 5/6)
MKRLLMTLAILSVPLSATALEPPPYLNAHAWLLIDYTTGNVLLEGNAEQRLPPASLTKLMTAYLIFERLKAGTLHLDDTVVVSANAAATHGARLYLKAGMRISAEDLIKSMLVRSANDATVALAEHIAGSEPRFVAEMNTRARLWGLKGTTFINSTGLDVPFHVSTARDLSRIAAAIIRDFPEYYRWFGLRDFSFNQITHHNSNGLLWRDHTVDGMKTGYTQHAGWCLVASAQHEQTRLIATVLGADSDRGRVSASKRLLDYGFRNFETRLIYAANRPATETRVWLGDSALVPLGVTENLYVTLPRGTSNRVHARLAIQNMLYAPIRYGQRLGAVTLALDDKPLAEYPLVALKEVGAGGIVQRAIDNFQLWLR